MRLRSFSAEGYKAFADAATVELRPLTLLYGYNHKGKSALLRVLPLLAESVASRSGPLALQLGAGRDASFGHLVSQVANRETIRFALDWDAPREHLQSLDLEFRGQVRLGHWFRHWVERFQAIPRGHAPTLELTWIPEKDQAANRRYRCVLGEVEAVHELNFSDLYPRLVSEDGQNGPLGRRLDEIRDVLLTFRSQVHWLSALRKPPPRHDELRATPERISPDGGGAVKFLAADQLGYRRLVTQVSDWFRSATGYNLKVNVDSRQDSETFSLTLSPQDAVNVRVPLLDAGEGMGQVLPILVLAGQAQLGHLGEDPILAIEHPELHLQPRAHADLAGVFCQLARAESPPQVLIETHSENFLMRIQLEILRGSLPADRVRVYWVRQDPDGRTTIKPIEIDDLAILEGWPPGVFETAPKQGREIMLARHRRHD